MTTTIDPASGPGKAVIIASNVGRCLVVLASYTTGGSKLVAVDLARRSLATVEHAPRV
jgi:hypothetical protein